MTSKTIVDNLKDIINNKKIKTVFQPIVNLNTSDILGYEALTRGPEGSVLENPQILFAAAKENKMLFELEKICRENAIYQARNLKDNIKLFINVDPFVIFDKNFKGGVTKNYLENLSMSPNDIVIELTEKTSLEKFNGFKKVLSHYKKEGYQIAIDDTGAGYSGIKTLISLSYKYMKIDRALIQDINKNNKKRDMLELIINYADKINSEVIAEGIETKEELVELIRLGINYGQGYYISRPDSELKKDIKLNNFHSSVYQKKIKNNYSIKNHISLISAKTVTAEDKTEKVVNMFDNNDNLQTIVVLENDSPIGLIMRDKLYYRLGTKFGYSVFIDRPIRLVMNENPMIIEIEESLTTVSKKAMRRKQENIYDSIIVTKKGKYCGILSVRKLLDKISRLKIEEAKLLNPLTNLPGNRAIEQEINKCIQSNKIFSVLYLDLDNFKVYNDNYGYKKGDNIIDFTSDLLKEAVKEKGNKDDFVGHIGGDDFVIITTPQKDTILSQYIIDNFDKRVINFFNEQHQKKGYITAINRQGMECKVPLTSISIAIVSNENREINNHIKVSDIAAEVKKRAKKEEGSIFVKDKRKDKKKVASKIISSKVL